MKLIGGVWLSDIGDHYWGKGVVGPTLYPPFQGSWYLSQP